jgi:hypothetical protein
MKPMAAAWAALVTGRFLTQPLAADATEDVRS